ncbi:MAG TPA: hypothetical protein VHC72_03990, partial [Bryobacteraceae bacterium]|nr:hypothetical protein [Bryobacteraceae bacterium]
DVVRAARRAGVEPSLILSSPYRRAMETARIAADEFAWKGDIIRSSALTPAKSPEEVWTELRDYRKEPAVLLASHEPLLGRLVAHLLSSPALRVEMKKAAMVRIDVENSGPVPRGTLCWMLTPKLCP